MEPILFTNITTVTPVLQMFNMCLTLLMLVVSLYICIRFLILLKMRALLINLFYILVFPLLICLLVSLIFQYITGLDYKDADFLVRENETNFWSICELI